MLNPSTPAEVAEIRQRLYDRVIGQEAALAPIVDAYARWKAGLAGLDKPVAAFLMVGPTGVGKTLTVEVLAEALHGDRHRLIKIHCAEHRAGHELARLIGSPAGYVGHRETEPALSRRRLDEARSDKCTLALILLDEIEKAHPDFWDLFLGILDKGELFLGNGERSDLRESMIFMTSNVGSRGTNPRNRIPGPIPPCGIALQCRKRGAATFLARVPEPPDDDPDLPRADRRRPARRYGTRTEAPGYAPVRESRGCADVHAGGR